MDLKNQLISALLDQLKSESAEILVQNVKKYNTEGHTNEDGNDDIFPYTTGNPLRTTLKTKKKFSRLLQLSSDKGFTLILLIGAFTIIGIIVSLFYFGGRFISNLFAISLLISILAEIGIIVIIIIIILLAKSRRGDACYVPYDNDSGYEAFTANYEIDQSPSGLFGTKIKGCCHTIILSLVTFFILGIIVALLYFEGRFISSEFGINLFVSILVELVIIIVLLITIFLTTYLVWYIYSRYEKRFNSIKPKDIEAKKEFDDDVYYIISNTYETLSVFKNERERQAKSSFNAALSLIIAGIFIVFLGVYLLFKKNVTEGSLTSGVGAISNILGGTIIKFYRDTNNRMDKLNNDLFVLNSAKVQYSMILKISDNKKRDCELSELIRSIGRIKSNGNGV